MIKPQFVRFKLPTAKRILRAVGRVEASDRTPTPGGGTIAQPPQQLFAVRVTIDGGSAGSISADCSFTYKAVSDDGFLYGEHLTPARRRLHHVPYTTTPDNSWGAGFWDKTGTFVLWDANETPDVEDPCP